MREVCPKIRENFVLYKTLIDKEKCIESPIIILEDGTHKNWRNRQENIKHNSGEEMFFGVAKQKYDLKYGLKIFIKQLAPEPVFYFDSDGPSHTIRDGKTKLSDTKVKTPHFNFYDKNGVKQAKRSEFIENNEDALQNDINLGMQLFCQETNINTTGSHPTILETVGMIALQHAANTDIHKNIDFSNES
jgi:hypothetical protein